MDDQRDFQPLVAYLSRVPGIDKRFGTGNLDDGGWWARFVLDIAHPLAWNVVPEFGHVLNCLSLDERLPTVFMPVSPPPCLNGGPVTFLSWVIECRNPSFGAGMAARWLEGRLPRPVEDLTQWDLDDDTDDPAGEA